MILPAVKVETPYVPFGGGIDLASPVLSVHPGALLQGMNYETGNFGGYKRIDGYERCDGRPAPSDALYYYATVSITGAFVVGQMVVGGTSGARAVVASITGSDVVFTSVVGTFVDGEQLKTTGGSLPLVIAMNYTKTVVGTLTSALVLNGAPTGLQDAQALNAAADVYRAQIQKPPGSGPTRGVWIYKGVKYAFRDTLDGTQGAMWKSSPGGWLPVLPGIQIAFTTGGTYEIQEGDTVVGNSSGATAVVARVVLESGTFDGGTAAGRLILTNQNGAFTTETLKVGSNLVVGGVAGNSSQITLLPGGRYEFENNNFFGSTDTFRMYGCDDVNYGFEYDGAVYVQIHTGMAEDHPKFLRVHKKQLFYSFRASSQNSGIGQPYKWSAVTGAAEIGIGDDVSGYQVQGGDVLIIHSRESTSQLLGSSVADFVLKPLAPEVGAIPYTAQNVMQAFSLDDRGVTQIKRSAVYGNFDYATVSRQVQPIIDVLRSKIVASAAYRQRNQYRVYGNDGSGLIITIEGNKVIGITQLQYPVNVTCACSGEDETGKDVIFFGDDEGWVYQADRGSSFDGEEIEAFLILVFNNLKSPRLKKFFRKVIQEMSAVGYSAIRFQPIFGYGDEGISGHALQTLSVQGAGGYWNVSNWDQFYWDARIVSTPEFKIEGSSVNIGMVYYSKSDIDLGHTLQGAIIHYTPRRLQR